MTTAELVNCTVCSVPFPRKQYAGGAARFCTPKCNKRHYTLQQQQWAERCKTISVPGTRLMTTADSLHRYQAGTVLKRLSIDEDRPSRDYVRIQLDRGGIFDVPFEHVDILLD